MFRQNTDYLLVERKLDVSIRVARPDDAPELLELIRVNAQAHGQVAIACTEHDLTLALADDAASMTAYVAVDAVGVRGAVIFSSGYSTFRGGPRIWIEDIVVDPTVRRCGLAMQLLDEVRATAALMGALEIQGAVLAGNVLANRFWSHAGFTAKPEWIVHSLDLATG